MKHFVCAAFALAIVFSLSAGSVSAHHSFAATYLEGQTQKIEGKVVQFLFRNPVYKHEEEGGTLIIPGHGRICDEYEVGEYRDMIAIIRDRVQAMINNQGATVEQVKGARLTADFDSRYGAVTGPWTTDMFVEAVYTSLKQGRPKAGVSK